MRIGFLGLGHMGLPMARNLLGQGHSVTVFNRTPGAAKSLVAAGAIEASSIAEAVTKAEVAITMLSDDRSLNEVVQGASGLLQHLPAKSIHLCMCTISVETSAALATAHARANQGYVAAPVFGRVDSADSRHLWIVAGGPEAQVNRCSPIFEALGRGYMRVGPNAALAHAVKLGGNILALAMEMAVSETLEYAKKAGLPPADYLRFLNMAVFKSHMVDTYGHAMARPSFDPDDQTLDLAASELLPQKARDMGVPIPVKDLLEARIQSATVRGWGEQDIVELTQACLTETGVEVTVKPAPPAPAPARPQSTSSTAMAAEPAVAAVLLEAPPGPKGPPPIVRGRGRSTPSTTKKPAVSDSKSHSTKRPPTSQAPVGAASEETPPASGVPMEQGGATYFPAADGGDEVRLALERTTHFELIKGQVWAWSQGKCFLTPWRSLMEVEVAFKQVLFLLIHRHVLLRPEAVLDIRSTFTGGIKARVSDSMELDVSRSAAPRLKELLGF